MTRLDAIGLLAFGMVAMLLGVWVSGQIGWNRGDSYAQWEAHFDREANKKTMEQIGTCRWAELVAGCTWKSSPTTTHQRRTEGK